MKLTTFIICLLTISSLSNAVPASGEQKDDMLIGTWKLDMTPNNPNDSNFATMTISKIEEGKVYGEFYRDGVKIQHGVINRQTDKPVIALVSADNSGNYNSSFYLEDGVLYGTTHAIDREFLAIWTATKL